MNAHEAYVREWDERVEKLLSEVNRQAAKLFWIGIAVYGGGTVLIFLLFLLFLQDIDLFIATFAQMFLFQLCIMYFGVRKMYTCLRGSFVVGLEGQRDSIPVFTEARDSIDDFNRALKDEHHPVLARWTRSIEATEQHMKDIRDHIVVEKLPVSRRPHREGEEVPDNGAPGESRLR